MLAGSEEQRGLAIEVAASLGIRDVIPTLRQMYNRPGNSEAVRVASYQALAELVDDQELTSLINKGQNDSSESIRIAALELLAEIDQLQAITKIGQALTDGNVTTQQKALGLLGELRESSSEEAVDTASHNVLMQQFNKLREGNVASSVILDLLQAAEVKPTNTLRKRIERFRSDQQMIGTKLAAWSECLEGGDAARGETIFFGRSDASCRRCHKVNGSGGEVGPDLSIVGKEKDRKYLLESLVDPNSKIAKGFETVVIVTIEGRIHSGILKEETNELVRLMSPQGAIITVAKEDIEERATGQSGMPVDITKNLSRSDVRDLVEYLSTLKKATDSSHGEGE